MSATAAQNAIAVVGIDIGKNSFHIAALDDRSALRLPPPQRCSPYATAQSDSASPSVSESAALAVA